MSGLRLKQIEPVSPFERFAQFTFDADSWEFSPTRLLAPGPFAVPVELPAEKSRPRPLRSNAPRYCTPAQSPLGVPEISNVSVLEPVWLKVNVRP